jgi:carbonic anhydrase
MRRFSVLILGFSLLTLSGLVGCERSDDSGAEKAKAVEKEAEKTQEPQEGQKQGQQEAEAEQDPEAMTMTKERQSEMSPEEAIERLQAGNERFVEDGGLDRDLNKQVSETAGGQYPFAAVLGCVDSRVPPEVIFDQGIGDIFSARVAGNFENEDILGSLEFAAKVAGSKAIVVLGHTSCGAVKGTCDNVELGHVTSLVEEIKPAMNKALDEGESCSSDNIEAVNKVAKTNVNHTVKEIRERSSILKEMEDNGEIVIVGAMYDVKTGEVEFY